KRKRPPRDKLGTVHLEIWTRRKWGFRCKVSVRTLRVRGQFGTWVGAIETWLVRHPSNALLRAHYAAMTISDHRALRQLDVLDSWHKLPGGNANANARSNDAVPR